MMGEGDAGIVRGVALAIGVCAGTGSGDRSRAATMSVSLSSGSGSGIVAGPRATAEGAAVTSGVPQKRQNSAPGVFAPRQREQIGPIPGRLAELTDPPPSPPPGSAGGATVFGDAGPGAATADGASAAPGLGRSAPHILQKFIPGRLSAEQRGQGTTGPTGAADGLAPVSGMMRRASTRPGTKVLATGAEAAPAASMAGSGPCRGATDGRASFCPQSWQNFKPSEFFEPQCAQASTAPDWNPAHIAESSSARG